MPNLRSPESRNLDVYAQAVRGLLALEEDGDKRAKYLECIDIYAGLTENEFRRYKREYPEESTTVAGVIERARVEGMQEGRIAVSERLLERRFGLLSSEIAEKLRGASASDLETWAYNVLDADTIDEVFG